MSGIAAATITSGAQCSVRDEELVTVNEELFTVRRTIVIARRTTDETYKNISEKENMKYAERMKNTPQMTKLWNKS